MNGEHVGEWRRFPTASTGAFDLLAEVGRDSVGALQLLPEDHPSVDVRKITAARLTTREVAERLKSLMEEVIDQTPQVVAQAAARLPRPFPDSIATCASWPARNSTIRTSPWRCRPRN